MLSKEQAIAAADALILKAEAERSRRIERRTARFVTLYPVLKGAPPEEREALVWAAQATPLNRWVMSSVGLVAALTALWAIFGGNSLGIDPTQQRPYPLAIFAGCLLGPAQYLCIRAFLRKEVPRRYAKIDEHASRSGA
jgi:hypothetical protein